MRLALIGAFPFPYAQGSQVYLAQQASALETAGASCEILSYARLPGWLAPRRQRSGPGPGKPLADAALCADLVRRCRRDRFDAVLAHNAEAAVVSLLARAVTGVPVVYVAHTLLAFELSAYGPVRFAQELDRTGHAIDGWIARRANGILVLSEDARVCLESRARGRVCVVPPGLERAADPTPEEQQAVCHRAGVEPGRFALYAGNLDGYQDLSLLDEAARLAPEVPVLVATHDARDGPTRHRHLRFLEIDGFGEARALHFAAGAAVLTRRRRGGFPIKLLNYMEAARAIVAFEGIAPGLRDGESAVLLDPAAGAPQWADALRALASDPARAEALGKAARARLEAAHDWPKLARRTLDFVAAAAKGAA